MSSDMKPTTNPKLEDRLSSIFAYGMDWKEYKDKDSGDHDVSTFAAKIKSDHKDQLKQTILSDLLQLVGDDEPEEYYTKRMGRMVAHPHKENWAKNKLRAQLKRAIRAYVGVES